MVRKGIYNLLFRQGKTIHLQVGLLVAFISGGYIMFVMTKSTISDYVKKYENTMQQLHDTGMWNWIATDTIPQYINKKDGSLYVFQKS